MKNLHSHISEMAKKEPEKAALISSTEDGVDSDTVSYKTLAEKIETTAQYFQSLDLVAGDVVALAFGNSIELLILSWAAWSMGIVTVPLDVKRDTGDLYKYKIKLSQSKLLIADPRIIDGLDKSDFRDIRVVEYRESKTRSGKEIEWRPDLSDTALILFTSGTTGYPKGAELTLKNLVVNAEGIKEWLHINEHDRFLVNLPLHHINSTTFCLATLSSGGTVVIPPGYSSSNFWLQLANSASTITSIVQSIVYDQLKRETEYTSLKGKLKLTRIQIGSAPVMPETSREFIQKYGVKLYQGYGQTETALRVTGVPTDLPSDLYQKLVEENSIGSPMNWARIEIADDEGKFLGENKEGEIVVSGEAVMSRYIGKEDAFRDGYFLTGDIGYYKIIEGRKFFFLKGRKREIIIKGGVNISPVFIENQLKKISTDIEQVHVIGIPDKRYGEEIGAIICWKDGMDSENSIRRLKFKLLSGTREISDFEIPKYIGSIAIQDLPTTSTGKVQRSILKESYSGEKLQSIYNISNTTNINFSFLSIHSPDFKTSHNLHNQCWDPLTLDEEAYRKQAERQFTILAKKDGHLVGQIAFIRTNLKDKELLKITHSELFTDSVFNTDGDSMVCTSICSASYKAKPVVESDEIPKPQRVLEYLLAGHDSVFNFHTKLKNGIGARLVGLNPLGRPKDLRSCGYSMLLKYSVPDSPIHISEDEPVSTQLIEMAMQIAQDMNMKNIYAYSRPGGLASFIKDC
ncbi:MAG: class I adenylate-forming enzyme family protein [Minisyncoccia bacterium]